MIKVGPFTGLRLKNKFGPQTGMPVFINKNTRIMSITICKLAFSDKGAVEDLMDNLLDTEEKPSGEHITMLLTDDRTFLHVAKSENKVVGYALAYRFPSPYSNDYLACLYDIEVRSEYRKKGIGRKLIQAVLADLKVTMLRNCGWERQPEIKPHKPCSVKQVQ
jgi:GNAT superfamily N-acetyltransferase